MLTPEERALLRQDELEMLDRAEKATEDPWQACISDGFVCSLAIDDRRSIICQGWDKQEIDFGNVEDNFRFIAHARADVPTLLSRLAAARDGERWIPVTERLPPESTPVEVRDMKRLDRAIAQLRGDEWLNEGNFIFTQCLCGFHARKFRNGDSATAWLLMIRKSSRRKFRPKPLIINARWGDCCNTGISDFYN